MKAILEFDLPEDGHEFRLAYNGFTMASALRGFSEYLRRQEDMDPKHRDDFVALRANFYATLDEILWVLD